MVHKKIINTYEAMVSVFPAELEKDLSDNERICPTCHGLGMVVDDNIFGLKGDNSELGKKYRFPYKKQALSFCPDCFNGVQEICPYCKKPYLKYRTSCDCPGAKEEKERIEEEKYNKLISNAKEVNVDCVENMLYCKEDDVFYENVDDFFDRWYDDMPRPQRLWVTSKVELSIDAANVIEDACSELHEDAVDCCDYKELQEMLDKWCSEQKGTTTYYPNYTEYVTIDWDKYNG